MTNELIELLTELEEAEEYVSENRNVHTLQGLCKKAAAKLRKLAEQKPIGWYDGYLDGEPTDCGEVKWQRDKPQPTPVDGDDWDWFPLYAAPVPGKDNAIDVDEAMRLCEELVRIECRRVIDKATPFDANEARSALAAYLKGNKDG